MQKEKVVAMQKEKVVATQKEKVVATQKEKVVAGGGLSGGSVVTMLQHC